MGEYDTMQVCREGHKITEHYDAKPEHRQKYCENCGSETLTECPECGASIRGHYSESGVQTSDEAEGLTPMGSGRPVPSYCHGCGTAHPWNQEEM